MITYELFGIQWKGCFEFASTTTSMFFPGLWRTRQTSEESEDLVAQYWPRGYVSKCNYSYCPTSDVLRVETLCILKYFISVTCLDKL